MNTTIMKFKKVKQKKQVIKQKTKNKDRMSKMQAKMKRSTCE